MVRPKMKLTTQIPTDERTPSLPHYFLFGFVVILKVHLSASGLMFENNPFYGLSNDPIRSVESITDDNLIRVKLEYALQQLKLVLRNFLRQLYFIMKKMK